MHTEVIQPAILNSTAIKLDAMIFFFLVQQNNSYECYVKNDYIYLFSKTVQPELNNLCIFRFMSDSWSYMQEQGYSF